MSTIKFSAPWGISLILVTSFVAMLLTGGAVLSIVLRPNRSMFWSLALASPPILILIIAMFFMIRGYVLNTDLLIIQRLGWNTKLDLSKLIAAYHDPTATAKSVRTFGNGGLFSFSGYFRNKKLGDYRAFATDPKRSVVLEFEDQTVVITPNKPKEFLDKLKEVNPDSEITHGAG